MICPNCGENPCGVYARCTIAELTRAANDRLNNEIEDALAGLMAAGVDAHDITLEFHPTVTNIAVRGVVKYTFKHRLPEQGYWGVHDAL